MRNAEHIVRVGGVGTGRIFQWAHTLVYPKLLEKARLVGFYDVNPARAREAKSKYTNILEAHAAEHPESAEAVKASLRRRRKVGEGLGLSRYRGRLPRATPTAIGHACRLRDRPHRQIHPTPVRSVSTSASCARG